MNIVAIIPARMGSSRFPGKPMAKIHGVPMIGHCYFRTRMCKSLSNTYVATCDKEIYDYIESIGGNAVMTQDSHERATDRTAEAMLSIEKTTGKSWNQVVAAKDKEIPGIADLVRTMVDQSGMDVYLNVNNHYEGSAPVTIEKLLFYL